MASAKEAHSEDNSAVEPGARDDATDDNKTDSKASVALSQKRRLPAGFDDQGPKKHIRASEIPTTSEQPKATTKLSKASEPPTMSEQPATEENSKDLGMPEDQSLAPDAKESEQPKAVKQAEPAEQIASPATKGQMPAEPGTIHENLESYDTVDTGYEGEPLQPGAGDRPGGVGPASLWARRCWIRRIRRIGAALVVDLVLLREGRELSGVDLTGRFWRCWRLGNREMSLCGRGTGVSMGYFRKGCP